MWIFKVCCSNQGWIRCSSWSPEGLNTKQSFGLLVLSCHMMLELSSCSVLVSNFALWPLWPCISFSCHVNVAEFQFFIIYMWLVLGPYQFNNGGQLCNVELPLSSMPLSVRWLSKGFAVISYTGRFSSTRYCSQLWPLITSIK